MRYQQDLQAALRTRYKRLKAANAWDVSHEIRLVTNWISQQPALHAVLAEAERAVASGSTSISGRRICTLPARGSTGHLGQRQAERVLPGG